MHSLIRISIFKSKILARLKPTCPTWVLGHVFSICCYIEGKNLDNLIEPVTAGTYAEFWQACHNYFALFTLEIYPNLVILKQSYFKQKIDYKIFISEMTEIQNHRTIKL